MCWKRLGLMALLAVGLGLAATALAQERIAITRGVFAPTPIAFADFRPESDATQDVARDIAGVAAADLESSGLFRIIKPEGFRTLSVKTGMPDFAIWRKTEAQVLVTGHAGETENDRLRVEFRLWDVLREEQMTAFAFTTASENWRRIGHNIADSIYERITGEEGYFDTRIVYIAESGSPRNRRKRLAIMDQDGANHRYLTDGHNLVLTPRFSPTAQEITYLSYSSNAARVYLYNIDSGRRELLGDFPGMSYAPRFSPDGNSVLMSLAINAYSNIYSVDLRTRQKTQLTFGPSIDTSPSFSPDGRRLVFESDRSGTQQLYVMDADGSNIQRISFGEGRYGSPVWSPRGDLIAFTKIAGGEFAIGVIRPDGSGERILTRDFHVEGPTWAPNGRVLMFFREIPTSDGKGRIARLYSIDLTGINERQIQTPVDASDPAWSPLLAKP